MKEWLRSNGFRQYLMLEAEGVDVDGFEVNMLLNCKGKWLLPIELYWQDGIASLGYETSGMISLEQSGENKEFDGSCLRLLFSSIWECYEDLEEYLLMPEGMLLSPEKIYYQPGKKTFGFCYYPGYGKPFQEELLKLAEFCMKHTSHQDSDAVLFIYELYHMLQGRQWKPEEWKRLVVEKKETIQEAEREGKFVQEENPVSGMEAEQAVGTNATVRTRRGFEIYIYGGLSAITALIDGIIGIRFVLFSHREVELKVCIILSIVLIVLLYSTIRSRKEYRLQEEFSGQKKGLQKRGDSSQGSCGKQFEKVVTVEDNSGETPEQERYKLYDREFQEEPESVSVCPKRVWMGEQDETVVLEAMEQMEVATWKLEEQGSGQCIPLNRLPGVLGRSTEDADYTISGAGVSRRHVLLFLSGEELYAEDLASTNGTFINGIRLLSDMPVLVSDGDLLMIGDIQYRVKRKKSE